MAPLGGVVVDVEVGGTVRISLMLAYGLPIHRTIHALYKPYMSSRSAQRIGRLFIACWMQTHSGCDFRFSY
jgi:hypothetical protein